ncbi:hypothetical protein BH18ACI3_BH18ACI3_03310 [soil metagenome]
MRKLIRKIAFVFLLFVAFSQAVYSCTCEAPSQRKAFRKAKAIFVGQVLEIKESKNQKVAYSLGLIKVYDIKFKVEKSWKGVKNSEITVVSDNGVLVCGGFPFRVGEKYLVYAKGNNLIVISDCERTGLFTPDSKEAANLNNFFFRLVARLLPF